MKFEIEYKGKNYTVTPRLELAPAVEMIFGKPMFNIAIVLDTEENGMKFPFAVLTRNFGEFIGQKGAAFIDTNNCPFAEQLSKKYHIGGDIGIYHESGFCKYPMWYFDEDFLRKCGEENYQKYSDVYDEYMAMFD